MSARDDVARRVPWQRLLDLAWRWGPVLLWMAGIFFFSSLSDPLGPASESAHSGLIGRAAHALEYAGLAALLLRALDGTCWDLPAVVTSSGPGNGDHPSARVPSPRNGGRDREGGAQYSLALLITLTYALSDELHQILVPGREFSLSDLATDAAGALLALAAIWALRRSLHGE